MKKLIIVPLLITILSPVFAQSEQKKSRDSLEPEKQQKLPTAELKRENLSKNYQQSASHGEGTRGGGEVVRVRNQLELRDLLERTNCEWSSGSDVFSSTSYLKPLMKKLSKLEPYFTIHLKKEIESLPFCFTQNLVQVNTRDSDSVNATYYGVQTKQAAIRLEREVYIDRSIFHQLSERSKALLIIHEAMHSYLLPNEEQRNQRLRSMVHTIAQVDAGIIHSLEKFYMQMTFNRINFPQVMDSFHPNEILLLLGNYSDQQQLILSMSESSLQSLIKTIQGRPLNLLIEKEIVPITMKGLLVKACKATDQRVVKHMIKFTSFESNPVLTCFSQREVFQNQTFLKFLEESPLFKDLFSKLYADLSASKVFLKDFRINVSGGITFLAAGETISNEVPLMSLRALNPKSPRFSSEMNGFLNLLVMLAYNGSWETLEGLVFNNPAAREAFALDNLNRTIVHVQEDFPGEKELAIENLIRIRKNFSASASEFFHAHLSIPTAEKISAKFVKLIE